MPYYKEKYNNLLIFEHRKLFPEREEKYKSFFCISVHFGFLKYKKFSLGGFFYFLSSDWKVQGPISENIRENIRVFLILELESSISTIMDLLITLKYQFLLFLIYLEEFQPGKHYFSRITLNIDILACRNFHDFENQFFLVFIFVVFSYKIISWFLFLQNKEFSTNQFKIVRTN